MENRILNITFQKVRYQENLVDTMKIRGKNKMCNRKVPGKSRKANEILKTEVLRKSCITIRV